MVVSCFGGRRMRNGNSRGVLLAANELVNLDDLVDMCSHWQETGHSLIIWCTFNCL